MGATPRSCVICMLCRNLFVKVEYKIGLFGCSIGPSDRENRTVVNCGREILSERQKRDTSDAIPYQI